MSVMTTRHQIEFGESVIWTPPPGTGAFFAWGKHAGADMATVPDVMFAAGAVDYCLEGFRRWAPIQQWLVKALATVP